MFSDLHIHTTASDGATSPKEVFYLVQQAGISAFSVTDHDTIEAISSIIPLAKDAGILFIPGIEINTCWNGNEYHILGYNIDWQNRSFNKTLQDIRNDRVARMHKMVGKLQEIGLPITYEDVLSFAAGESLCRPHLAAALLQKGVVNSIDEAFASYLSKGQAGYVSRKTLSPKEAVDLIHSVGGISALAHPGRMQHQLTTEFLNSLAVDAIEVLHPDHDKGTVAFLSELAQRTGLLTTGGSDYHGYPGKSYWSDYTVTGNIGSEEVPLEWAVQLLRKKEHIITDEK